MRTPFCIAAALLLASSAASAQNRTTELQARSYIQSAFITGVAHAILADDVALGTRLRERLALPADAKRDRVYEAIFALTADRQVRVRRSIPDEERSVAARAAGQPVFALEGGAEPLLVVYDLDRNVIAYVTLLGAEAAVGATRPPPAAIRLKPIEFGFNDATLRAEAKAELEHEVLPKMVELREMRYVIQGHADPLGEEDHNRRLSQQRAQAVRDYLVERGIDARYIEVVGLGSTMTRAKCEQKSLRELIDCFAPDRRVTVEIQPPEM